jgi:hypothetical protein
MTQAGGKNPCYKASTHPDVWKDLNYLKVKGHRITLGEVICLINDAIDECVTPDKANEQAGPHLLYVRESLPIVGVFTVNFPLAHLTILSMADTYAHGVALARSRV